MPLPSAADIATMTPMMQQYYEIKQRYENAVLFFRMGDFYEIFGADAEEVAPVLELVLTSRERGDQKRIPFCGVPHHSARNYWLKLLRKGYKVALADQIEDPAEAKGLVRRDVTRVLTPGCIDDLDALDRDAPNYVMAAHEEPGISHWTVAIADLSTGELRLGSVPTVADLKSLVELWKPKELLARRFFHKELEALLQGYMVDNRLLVEALPEGPLRDKSEQKSLLKEVFGKADLSSQPCGEIGGGEPLVTALLCHFRALQAGLGQFLSVRPLAESNTMTLDDSVIRDLEIFETTRRRQTDGSLFLEINHTLSPMGARLLRYFLGHPLLDAAQIRARHAAVRSLMKLGEPRLSEVRHELKGLPDLERLATRIFAGSATPVELARVSSSLERAKWILENLTGEKGEKLPQDLYRAVATGLKFHKNPYKILGQAMNPAPTGLGSGNGVFIKGYDETLDRLNELARSGESQVEAYQEKLKAATGIGSLKIKNHKSFGLLIEVTRTHQAKVPKDFIRRQTMVNCERFTTVELQELNETLASASDQATARETALYQALLQELAKFRMDIRSVAQAMATFDLLQSFAWLALRHDYCEPKISEDERIELKGSRHPVVERYVGRHVFAPNDVTFSQQKKHLLITGPNMAGKSTVMRQTAIAAVLCQIGSFVPALSARLPVFDRIFTRVGAADDLSRGQSTFMVEMSEAAHILRHATQRSLVILDEVGRGTSTTDGLALASAILQDLATRVRCFSMFATHYHELVPFAADLACVKPMQTEVLEQGERIVFTHRLKDGASDSSYGLEVARLAGVPEAVLAFAAAQLAKAPEPVRAGARQVRGALATPVDAPLERMGLSGAASRTAGPVVQHDTLERLARLNINRLTPIQAINILAELQGSLQPAAARSLFPEDTV